MKKHYGKNIIITHKGTARIFECLMKKAYEVLNDSYEKLKEDEDDIIIKQAAKCILK